MKYQRYPAYKDSGVEWIGEIPEHWKLTKLKSVCHFNYGDSLPTEDRLEGEFPVFGSNGIIDYNSLANTGSPTIIIGRKGSYGKLFYSSLSGFAIDTTFFVNEKTSKVNLKWLYYVLGILHLDMYSLDTGVPGLSRENAYEEIIVLPSNEEQFLISNFLDSRTNRIDILISKQHNMIELLKEERQAIITNAVTKGLDPNVPMKDSGVEWIGEIPEHWNIQKLKRIFQVLNGSTPRSDNPLYWNGNIIWVTPEDLSLTVSPVICKSSRQITAEGYDSCGTNLVPKGSIIVSTRAPIGYVKISGVELCTNQGCRSLVKKTEANENYFFYYLYCFGSVLNSLGRGSTFAELSSENLKMFQISIPPIEEQLTITQFLASETSKIDGLISKHLKLIDLLKEYKTSLITQAVTGKIDVRGFTLPTTSSDANQ